VLKRFDPEVLEGRLKEKSMTDAMLPVNRRARLWNLYTELYREIAAEAADDFNKPFEREFVRAYEEQVARLSISKAGETPEPRPLPEPERYGTNGDEPPLDVDCSVWAPPRTAWGNAVLVQVFLHRPEFEAEARALAREFDADAARRGITTLTLPIAHGTRVRLHLEAATPLLVHEPFVAVEWRGRTTQVQFSVDTPPRSVLDENDYNLTLRLYIEEVPVGRILFKLTVGPTGSPHAQPVKGEAHRYTSAFASYASQDRNEVLSRIQGMQKSAPFLDIFFDRASLRPGEDWRVRLVEEIERRDVFFLFWSRAARSSEWVETEWKTALDRKGLHSISPVPLEGPEIAPPPHELSSLHFDDWTRAYRQGT